MLHNYISVSQLLITVAAASIAFGGRQASLGSLCGPKLFLACSILYGISFCAFLLYRYDEYSQDAATYTRFWYCTVESFGFAALICFGTGYLLWALQG